VQLFPDGSQKVTLLARIPFANGIAQLNDSVLAVSSSSTGAVRLYSIIQSEAGRAPELAYLSQILVPFLPDNLSLTSSGKLLIAGHPHAPSLEILAKNNGQCVGGSGKDGALAELCQKSRLSWVMEWSAEDGVKDLYAGRGFGSSTTAVRDEKRGVGIATGLYQKGLLVWREK
jgi:hypothetical protein